MAGRSGRPNHKYMPKIITRVSALSPHDSERARDRGMQLTIKAMPAHCTSPASRSSVLKIFQPDCLFCLPPARMTRYAIKVMPSMTTAKDIRKPTVRHMEQKLRLSP